MLSEAGCKASYDREHPLSCYQIVRAGRKYDSIRVGNLEET